jgi:hypothetical protein
MANQENSVPSLPVVTPNTSANAYLVAVVNGNTCLVQVSITSNGALTVVTGP